MRYSESHEWIKTDDEVALIGVTDHAQQELGDIVFVELPEVGKSIKAGEEAAVLESTKAAADVYSPISGEVIEVNDKLNDSSELVNQSPESDGWIFKLKMTASDELEKLMTEDQYKAMLK